MMKPDDKRRESLVAMAYSNMTTARRKIAAVERLVDIRADEDAARVCEEAAQVLRVAADRLRGEWPNG